MLVSAVTRLVQLRDPDSLPVISDGSASLLQADCVGDGGPDHRELGPHADSELDHRLVSFVLTGKIFGGDGAHAGAALAPPAGSLSTETIKITVAPSGRTFTLSISEISAWSSFLPSFRKIFIDKPSCLSFQLSLIGN